MKAKYVRISIEDIDQLTDDGIIYIWAYYLTSLNTKWKSKIPIYDILNSSKIYKLCTEQEIEVNERFLIKYFTKCE